MLDAAFAFRQTQGPLDSSTAGVADLNDFEKVDEQPLVMVSY